MQNFLQDIDTETSSLGHQTNEGALSHEGASQGFHEASNDNLMQEILAMKSEMEDYRVMAQKELKSAMSEVSACDVHVRPM